MVSAFVPTLRVLSRTRYLMVSEKTTIIVLTILLGLAFSFVQPRFYSPANIENLFRQTSFLLILTLAQMFPIVTRGFDLSTGNLLSVVSVVTALTMARIATWWPNAAIIIISVGILAGLGVGVVAGTFNGCCIAFGQISNFVVTIGMTSVFVGIASTISGGFPVFGLPAGYSAAFAINYWLAIIPPPVVIAAAAAVLVHFVLRFTLFGRTLYIIGSNPRAAHVAGLPVRGALCSAYVICSFGTALAGVLLTARTGSGEPMLGSSQLTLQSIVAAVIGGVSLGGGRGGVIECIFGAIFVTVLSVGMNLVRIEANIQLLVLGATFLAAILLDRFGRSER